MNCQMLFSRSTSKPTSDDVSCVATFLTSLVRENDLELLFSAIKSLARQVNLCQVMLHLSLELNFSSNLRLFFCSPISLSTSSIYYLLNYGLLVIFDRPMQRVFSFLDKIENWPTCLLTEKVSGIEISSWC